MALWKNTNTAAGRPKQIPGRLIFNGATDVVNSIITSKRHKLQTGDVVVYSAGGGTPITGLTENTVGYYVVRISADTIKLAETLANAIAVTPTTITLSGAPAGAAHSILMANIFFVDETEAGLVSNHNKGINGGGWWKVVEYVDSDGSPRYKTECLVSMGTPAATSGDASDDTTVPDAESLITISGHPAAASTTVALSAASFAVTAAASTGTIAYQWQRAAAATPNKFSNVVNATTLAYAITSALTTANSGDRYRVVISNNAGAAKVVSNAVTLTVTA